MLVFSTILVINPPLLEQLTWEDGPVEYVGFGLLVLTGMILLNGGFRAVRNHRKYRLHGTILLIAGMGFLLAAGEEISWGQRLIGFETPEVLLEVNDQDEFNLHNIEKGLIDHSVRYGIALFAIAGFAFYVTKTDRFLGFKTPDLYLIHAFLLLGIYQNFQAIDKPFYLSAAAILLALLYFLLKGPRAEAWIPGISIAAGCLVLFLHWRFQHQLGINTPPEIRESIFPLICAAYAIGITRQRSLPQR
jgi:hypothetical protein